MGESVAILIGNTTYDTLNHLSCCANDVKTMRDLLLSAGKFQTVCDFVDRPVNEVKDQIRRISEMEDEVEEVFLYFSGHGHSNADDFYMCFGDFREESPNVTGLSRTEAFELVRSLDAGLSVVVIDACESGRNLIKSDMAPLTKEIKFSFSNFVQFSSCTERQYSLAGDPLSLFTKEFIRACLVKRDGAVYYSDIEGALRDAFLNHPSQTPHFIRQGTSQEKFCSDASLLDDFRESFLSPEEDENATEIPAPVTALAAAKAAIQHIESQVPTKEKAQSFIDRVFEATLKNSEQLPEILDFFDVRIVKYDDFDHVQNKRAVVNLLQRRGGSDSFVESDVERIKRPNFFGGLGLSAMAAFAPPEEYDTTYNILNNCGLSAIHVGIYFEPKFMALNRVFSEIVFLPRLTECLILTCNSRERRAGWGSFNEHSSTKNWRWSHHAWSDDPGVVAERYVSDPYDFTKDYVLSFRDSSSR